MLKRISVHHLTLGMYLHEFCGSWMDHPFWRTKFLLNEQEDLDRILATSIHECWIDVEKGLDVLDGTHTISEEEANAVIESTFSQLDTLPPVEASLPHEHLPPVRDTAPSDLRAEVQKAAAICTRAKQAMVDMFSEARMGKAVDPGAAHSLVNDISDSITRNPHALISLARLKTADNYTYLHSVAVCALMVALAKQLKMDEEQCRLAGLAGLLHDLGKAAIPLEVLNKPGKLTEEEFTIVRHHPVASFDMLTRTGNVPETVLDACLHHHEKMDGTGYPHRLAGDAISTIARMTAICDVYDAITSDRCYKRGWDPSASLRRMAEWTTDHFDPRLFQAFVKCIGIYPVGSLVRLSSGRLAVVVEQSAEALIKPRVKAFYSTRAKLRIPPEIIDLSLPNCTDSIASREDPDHWQLPDLNDLWMEQPA